MKNLLLVGSAALSLTACAKKEDATPTAPAAPAVNEATVNMAATYYDSTPPRGLSFVANKRQATQYNDRLLLYFTDALDQDRLTFTIPTSKLKPAVVGTYTLKSQPDPGQGDAEVGYIRAFASSAVLLNTFGSNGNKLEAGSLIITAYDASRHLYSGTYTLTIRNVRDPYSFLTASGLDPRALCDIRLYGTFTEVGS